MASHRLVTLGDGHDDAHAGAGGVLQGLERLLHDSVVRRHHQHHQVRDARPARAHLPERRVPGRVQERQVAASLLRQPAASVHSPNPP